MITTNALWACRCGFPAGQVRSPDEDYCGLCLAVRPGAGVPMPTLHRLVLPITPPRVNQYRGRHWRAEHKAKQLLADHIRAAMIVAGVPRATGKRRVYLTVILTKGQQRPDRDAYDKCLLDCLKKCKLIVNDSPVWLEGRVEVDYIRAEKACSIIHLEDLDPPAPPRPGKTKGER